MPLSIYVHVPFCESLCYYCACNKIITKHHSRGGEYLGLLAREIDLHVAELGRGQGLSQLHLGGGTPTFLSDDELSELMALVRRASASCRSARPRSRSIRAPRPERLRHLVELGFNRLSFGVQDFDPEVQAAVHRVQPFDSVQELVAEARALRFESINVDLIYGLPRQTPESFHRSHCRGRGRGGADPARAEPERQRGALAARGAGTQSRRHAKELKRRFRAASWKSSACAIAPMSVLWSAFLMAAVLEMVVFALVDPDNLRWFGGDSLDLSPRAVYTAAFFVFWAVISAGAGLAVLLCTRPDDQLHDDAAGVRMP